MSVLIPDDILRATKMTEKELIKSVKPLVDQLIKQADFRVSDRT